MLALMEVLAAEALLLIVRLALLEELEILQALLHPKEITAAQAIQIALLLIVTVPVVVVVELVLLVTMAQTQKLVMVVLVAHQLLQGLQLHEVAEAGVVRKVMLELQ
jgi:hypothetical protein